MKNYNNITDISLCIVTYNNSEIIESTLLSLIQAIPNNLSYQIFVVDNASTDKTLEIVAKINGNIVIINNETNVGFGRAHNQVMEFISSKYHIVVNPDIKVEDKDQIAKMIKFLNNNPNIGLLSPLILNENLSIQYLCKKNPTVSDMFVRRFFKKKFLAKQNRYINYDTGYSDIMNLEYASGCFMVFKTDIFKEIEGFDPRFFMYLEDADITRKVNEISNVVFFPYARVIHKWQRDSHKKFKYVLITIHSMVVYFKKWGIEL